VAEYGKRWRGICIPADEVKKCFLLFVIPAQAGIHHPYPKSVVAKADVQWIPAFAGMT
jgi:hypothetical protein